MSASCNRELPRVVSLLRVTPGRLSSLLVRVLAPESCIMLYRVRAPQLARLTYPLFCGAQLSQDPTATNMDECVQYVVHTETQAGGLFSHQSEHASFQIVTPNANVRLSHGRLHQIATRDPTDQFDLPDHVTWQMNMGIDHHDVSGPCHMVATDTLVTCDARASCQAYGGEHCCNDTLQTGEIPNSGHALENKKVKLMSITFRPLHRLVKFLRPRLYVC